MNKIIRLSIRLQHVDFRTITKLLFKFGLSYWRTGKHSQDTSRQFGNKETICQMSISQYSSQVQTTIVRYHLCIFACMEYGLGNL